MNNGSFLQLQDKLPVVAFTLSRNRCDQNANLLTSLDLTTAVEKGDIHHFIQKCMQRLKVGLHLSKLSNLAKPITHQFPALGDLRLASIAT